MKCNVVWKRTEIEQKGIYAFIHLFIRILEIKPRMQAGTVTGLMIKMYNINGVQVGGKDRSIAEFLFLVGNLG